MVGSKNLKIILKNGSDEDRIPLYKSLNRAKVDFDTIAKYTCALLSVKNQNNGAVINKSCVQQNQDCEGTNIHNTVLCSQPKYLLKKSEEQNAESSHGGCKLP